jgi:hypothetical protein
MDSVTKFSIFIFRFDLVSEFLYYAHFTKCPQHDNIMKMVLLSQPLYSSLNTIHELKSKRVRWVEHVALMVEKGDAYRDLAGKTET